MKIHQHQVPYMYPAIYIKPSVQSKLMIDRKRSMFISPATLQLLLICMIFTLHDMNRLDMIRMIGVNAQQQRTCDVSKNKKVLLYYNASKGMYVPYDDITINVVVVNNSATDISSMTNNTNTRRQTRRRNRERRMNYMVQDEIRHNHQDVKVHSDGFIQRLIDYFVGDVDDDEDENGYVYEYNNDYFDMTHDLVQSVPAIQIINPKTLPIDDNNTVDSRSLAATLGSIRNRDADGVYDINPHIQLYEPTDGKIIEVRPCHCVNSWNDPNPSFYCPIDKRNCFVPRMVSSSSTSSSSLDYPNHPVCLNAPSARWYFAKYLKLLGLVSFILIIVILCVSPYGRHAIRFCCKPFGCFNKRYIHHVIDKKSDERNQLLQRYMKVREDQYTKRFKELQRLHGEIDENDNENDGTNDTVPVSTQQKRKVVTLNEIDESIIHDIYYYRPSLLLKTRIYETNKVSSTTIKDDQNDDIKISTTQSSDPNDTTTTLMNDTDQSNHIVNSDSGIGKNIAKKEDSCMICFSTFENGCKVGVLPNCSHTFHSKCLKDWLKRRNVCPLCLESDVATTAFSYKTIRNTTTITTMNNNSTDTDETLR